MNPCIYCGAPWPTIHHEIDHKTDCPSVTGLFPVLDRDLGQKVPCPCGRVGRWPGGFGCTACGHQFVLGEVYVLREIGPEFNAVVCLSCEATNRPLSQPV